MVGSLFLQRALTGLEQLDAIIEHLLLRFSGLRGTDFEQSVGMDAHAASFRRGEGRECLFGIITLDDDGAGLADHFGQSAHYVFMPVGARVFGYLPDAGGTHLDLAAIA